MESKNCSYGYIEEHVDSTGLWFRHFDMVIKRRIKAASSGFLPTLENERVPDSSEMSNIATGPG